MLASPEFLYRAIRGQQAATAKAGEVALTEYELATRLSYFLWNTGPDEELFKLAATKELSKPAVLDAQVKRMLADPRAASLATNFAMKWLGLDGIDGIKPDQQIYTSFNDQLKRDLVTEAQTFIQSILLENRPLVELLTSDQTYLNDRVARHYGITDVAGSQFRWVKLDGQEQFRLLGKGAVLIKTSYPDRTSPVLRGAWVLDKIIGTPPTPPPPGVETDLNQKPGETPKTVRARLEQHRDNATCRQCHGVIDPMGLALENFDAVGQFRTADRQAANAPIDASTVLPNGPHHQRAGGIARVPGERSVEIRAVVHGEADDVLPSIVALEYSDMPQVRAVVRGAAKENYTLSSIVQGIVRSDAFLKQGPAPAPKPAGTKAAQTNVEGDQSHVYFQKTYFPKNSAERRRSDVGFAVPGSHGSCGNRTGADRGQAEDSRGLLLHSSRRRSARHQVRSRGRSVDAEAVPGADFKLNEITAPLEPFKKYVSIDRESREHQRRRACTREIRAPG